MRFYDEAVDELTARTGAARLSIISNSFLIVAKLCVGFAIGSVAVVSEAVHSGVDLIASFIAFLAVRLAAAPADERHPYGYGKVENVSGVLEALLIFAGAGWIAVESIRKLISPEPVTQAGWGVAVMGLSAGANWLVSARLFKVGQRTDSMALIADAWHLRTDVYTSLGVMAGLGVMGLGARVMPGVNLHWVDPVSAILVAVLIVRAAWELTSQAGRDLLDERLGPDDEGLIRDRIRAFSDASRPVDPAHDRYQEVRTPGDLPDVRGFHALRSRKAGSRRFVDFHLVIDGHMSVLDSHEIAMEISRDIEGRLQGAHVVTHVEPCVGRCTPRCLEGCLLSGYVRDALRIYEDAHQDASVKREREGISASDVRADGSGDEAVSR